MKLDLHELALRIAITALTLKLNGFLSWDSNTRADFVSRFVDVDDWQVTDEVFNNLNDLWGPFTVDFFANYCPCRDFAQKAKSQGGTLVARAYSNLINNKYFQLKYTVSWVEKISICLIRGRMESVGDDNVFYCSRPQVRNG